MPLTVTIEFPIDVEEKLRQDGSNLNAAVKEAFTIDLFRRGRVSHYELSRILELDRLETDAWLKRHNLYEGSPTLSDLEADRETLDRVMRTVH
jgi:predicted HTH domain antitoxin